MRDPKPTRAMLPHSVTLWNVAGYDTVNGSQKPFYQKTFIKNVYCENKRSFRQTAEGMQAEDSFFLMIFEGVSLAYSEIMPLSGGEAPQIIERRYVTPDRFINASEEERAGMWTLTDGEDFIGLGLLDGHFSDNGRRSRKDYQITRSDAKRGMSEGIHHWEVYGA